MVMWGRKDLYEDTTAVCEGMPAGIVSLHPGDCDEVRRGEQHGLVAVSVTNGSISIADTGLRDGQKQKRGCQTAASSFFLEPNKAVLIPDAAPHFVAVDFLIGVERLRLLLEHVGRLWIGRVGNTTVIHGADSRALRLVEVAHAFRAPIMRNDVDVVAYPLAIADVVTFAFGVAACLKDRLIRAFRQASPARNTFIGNQKCHDPRLLLRSPMDDTLLTSSSCHDHISQQREAHSKLWFFGKSTETRLFRSPRAACINGPMGPIST
jgi:hypothetical protein